MDESRAFIAADRYLSADFAAREWERMWSRVWLVLAHTSEVPAPGSFVARQIGPESIVAVHGADGEVRCFFNVCPHRGNRIAREGAGSVSELRCGYHGWRWDLSGKMLPVPDADRFPAVVQRCEVGLVPVPMATWGGFIWVCLDDDPAGLEGYLGEMAGMLGAYQLPEYRLIRHNTIHLRCNWKAFVDGVNEAYHIQASHPQLLDVLDDTNVPVRDVGRHSVFSIRMGVPSPRLGSSTTSPGLVEWLRREGLDPDTPDPRNALQLNVRERASREGWDVSRLTDDQLVDGVNHYVFPNTVFDMHAERGIVLCATPGEEGPDHCVVEEYVLEREAAGREASRPRSREIRYPRESISPVMDQDARNLVQVQKGMRSRAFSGIRTGSAEVRIRRMHAEIDRYLADGEGSG